MDANRNGDADVSNSNVEKPEVNIFFIKLISYETSFSPQSFRLRNRFRKMKP